MGKVSSISATDNKITGSRINKIFQATSKLNSDIYAKGL